MATRPLRPGTMIAGKYCLLERLGGGGMGDVYRAEHQLAGRVVALKLLKADYAEDQDLTVRFFQEAQAANRIRHPNIVDVLDAGFSELGPYVAMECLEGVSVSAALATFGRFDLLTAVSIVLPVLDALGAAHRHGIIHRDLKPENIFLARNAVNPPASVRGARRGEWAGNTHEVLVKILDFGIAKVGDGGGHATAPRTHTGIVFGTPDYLSPEQARGDAHLDGRSDLFSLGIVLFELLSGKRPFSASGAVATAYRIVHEPTPRLAEYGIQADTLLQIALDTALAKRPHERFATAAAFADMLAPLAPDMNARRETLRRCVEGTLGRIATARPDAPSSPPPSQHPTRPAQGAEVQPEGTPLSQGARIAPLPPAIPTLASASAPAEIPKAPPPPSLREPISVLGAPSSQGVWDPRSTPASAREPSSRDRCHVRGTFVRALDDWIGRTYGPAARAEALRLLPPEHAEGFYDGAFEPLVWYGLEPVDLYCDAAGLALMGGDATTWRELARTHFERELGGVFRKAGPSSPDQLLWNAPAAWRRLLDFGAMRVPDVTEGHAVLRVERFEAASMALRSAMLGVMEGLLRSAGAKDVEARVLAGNAAFAPDYEYELTWKP